MAIATSEVEQTLENIRTYAKDVESFESRIKTLKEMQAEAVAKLPEADEVEKAQEVLTAAKEALKQKLQQNESYMNITQDLADEKDSLKAAREHLSDHILGYYHLTGSKQAELEAKDARDLIMKARLGKSQLFQPSLFHEAHGAPAE